MMCHKQLVARGVKKIRFICKEDRTRPVAPERNPEEIAKRKSILAKKAQRPEKVAKRERRKQAKKEKEGLKNLRRQDLIH